MSQSNSVVLSEYDCFNVDDTNKGSLPKTSPAGYKVVQAKYIIEHYSMWLVPDNVDESLLCCKWDTLYYGTTDIKFQKVMDAENMEGDSYKYANELKICVGDTAILEEEDIYFDCEDADVDKEVLENASKAVKLFHEEPI
jgi:hypothetical protein